MLQILQRLFAFGLLILILSFSSTSYGQALITQRIDEAQRVTLAGNTHFEARPANDRGAVADEFPMEHMALLLRRSPAQEQALHQVLADLQDPDSPEFHKWMTADQFGAMFGLGEQDLQAITGWLAANGFRVNLVYPNHLVVDFSGTAAQVRRAFRAELHQLDVNGERHIANMSDPQLPATLAPAVVGIASLSDFMPKAM